MSDDNAKQDRKTLNLNEMITDTHLESVVLSRLGATDPDSKSNSLNSRANDIAMFERIQRKYKKHFSVLDEVKRELKRKGNFEFVSQLDPQSQAIIKTAYKPCYQEAD